MNGRKWNEGNWSNWGLFEEAGVNVVQAKEDKNCIYEDKNCIYEDNNCIYVCILSAVKIPNCCGEY